MATEKQGKILKTLERITMAHMDSNILYKCFVDLNAGKPGEALEDGSKGPEGLSPRQVAPDIQEADAPALPSAESFVR